MHARNRTWLLGSDPVERCRQRTLPVEGGDGSTLSLDFTTGVLDPRLTFTRTTNATFINSQGLVQYAAANEFLNTAWITSTTPTGWSVGFGTGTTTWNNNGTVTMDTGPSSTRPMINASSMTVAIGIPHTFGYRVVSVSGSPTVGNVIHSTVAGETYAINGVTQPSSTVVVAGDIVSCTFTPTASPVPPRMGPGVQGGMTNTSMTITQPQMNRGTTLQPYLENSSTSVGNFNTPRFDYDPTSIGTPRGLLIEGSATNSALNSDVMRGTGWAVTNLVTPSNAAGVTDPANGTNSTNYIANSTTGYHASGVVSTTTGASTTAVTWSCWVRANGYTKVLMAEGNTGRGAVSFDIDPNNTTPPAPTVVGGAGSPTGTITRYPNNWYRIAMRVGVASSTAYQWAVIGYPTGATLGTFGAQYTGDSTNGIYVWGAMLEDGSGASSYIPTGASQGTRNAESCALSLSAIPLVTSEGSFVVRYDAPRANLGSPATSVLNTDYQATEWIGVFQAVNSVTVSLGSWSGQSNISAGTTTSNIAAFSYGAWTGSVVPTSFVVNNSAVTNVNRDWNPALPSWLLIGAASSTGSSTANRDWLNSCIRSVKYWPTRLPDAQLKSLTT